MSRKIEDLNPVLADKCRAHIYMCELKHIDILPVQTLRTADEQTAFYAQGRDNLINVNILRKKANMAAITATENLRVVTNSQAGSSYHEYGLAYDIAILIDGKPTWKGAEEQYKQAAEIGKSLGLVNGGSWGDLPHYQFTFGLTIKDLKSGKSIPNTV